MKINNKGSMVAAGLILIAFLMITGYFGYVKMMKPEQVKKELTETEKEALKVFAEFNGSKNVNFELILPKYVPKDFYLNPAMGPSKEGNNFNFLYNNINMTRIDVMERKMTSEEKTKYLENQKKFPYETVELKNGIIAVKFGGETVKGKEKIPGTDKEVELSLGMLEYRFFIDDVHITIVNSVMSGGGLVESGELIKMANSMIE